jgi:hypothetical protein
MAIQQEARRDLADAQTATITRPRRIPQGLRVSQASYPKRKIRGVSSLELPRLLHVSFQPM